MRGVEIKCTYACLYDPDTGEKLYSIQHKETGNYPFAEVGEEVRIKDNLIEVTLNDEAVNHLLDKTSNINRNTGYYDNETKKWVSALDQHMYLSSKYVKLQKILATTRKVMVKQAAIVIEKPTSTPDDGGVPEKDYTRLIWLILAGILASL